MTEIPHLDTGPALALLIAVPLIAALLLFIGFLEGHAYTVAVRDRLEALGLFRKKAKDVDDHVHIGPIKLPDLWFEPAPDLAKLGVTLSNIAFACMRVGCAALFFFIVGSLFHNVLFYMLGGVLGWFVPWLVLIGLSRKRSRKFTDQLSQALPMIAENMRAGLTPEASFQSVSEFMQNPLKSELDIVCTDLSFGTQLADALEKCGERLQDKDMIHLAAVVGVVREAGGNLADLLDIEAEHLAQRIRMRGHIRAITSAGRMQGTVLAVVPFLLMFVLSAISPDPYGNFWMGGSPTAIFALVTCVVMDAVAGLIMYKIYNIKIQ